MARLRLHFRIVEAFECFHAGAKRVPDVEAALQPPHSLEEDVGKNTWRRGIFGLMTYSTATSETVRKSM